jgi:Uma2 family endonuclease
MNPQTAGTVEDGIEYPDCDGNPIAEKTRQFRYIVMIQGGLDALFSDRIDVFVAGDLLWYPVRCSNFIRAAPDAMVAFGRPKGDRGSYRQWRENDTAPQVVWEVLSPGNTAPEMAGKRQFYERYGVEEYYEYDPDRGRVARLGSPGEPTGGSAQCRGLDKPAFGCAAGSGTGRSADLPAQW